MVHVDNIVPNVLYDELPESWNGYQINWWFQIGIQIYLASEDCELTDQEKTEIIVDLLFPEEIPSAEEIDECINWFLNGWSHDRTLRKKQKKKLIDFNKDQWRIYADFRQVYGINLNEAEDLHWWEFMGMLWNMPYKQSTFLQVIEIRKKRIKAKMFKEEREAIKEAQYIYGLEDRKEQQTKNYSKEETQKIDTVDLLREKMKAKRKIKNEAAEIFRR